jgi:hypothetical protein
MHLQRQDQEIVIPYSRQTPSNKLDMQDLSSHTRLRYIANMLQAGKEPVL